MTTPDTMTAKARIADAIDRCQRNWDRMLNLDVSREERDKSIANIVGFVPYIVLLEVMRRQDGQVADRVAQWVHDTVDAGGDVGEWLWQWRRDLEAGLPLSLPAFDKES